MFDEDRALESAMRLFWEKGYEATSTQDLCEATGLGRSSVYNTFDSKHALFMRALARYIDMTTSNQLALLDDPARTVTERIEALFAATIETEEENRREGRGIGCLGVNSSTELAGRDAEVAELIRRDQERRLDSLRQAVAAGQRAGELADARDADALARFLNAVIAGMRVSAQNGADRRTLEGIAACAMDSLTH